MGWLMQQCCLLSRVCRDSACTCTATSSLFNKDSIQQKDMADSLPHVVCLKCDPNEVTGLISKDPDKSKQLNHISSVKINLQFTVYTGIENSNMHI